MSLVWDNVTSSTVSNASEGAGADPHTFSHTIGGGNDRILLVCIECEGSSHTNSDISTVTYNGVTMTKAVDNMSSVSPTNFTMNCEIWYLLEASLPVAGAYTVSITSVSGSTGEYVNTAGAISLSGVNQTAPEATATNDDGSLGDQTIQTNITTLTDNACIVDCVGSGNAITGLTPDAGQTERYDQAASSSRGAGSTEDTTTAGLYQLGWTADSSSNRLSHVLVALAPAALNTPTISGMLSKDGAMSLYHSENNVIAQGTNFEATQAGGKVEIGDNADYGSANLITQNIESWSDLAIEFTVSVGTLTPGNLYLFITNNSNDRSQGFPINVAAVRELGIAGTNYYSATQLTEQSTTSVEFIDVPSSTLTFTPDSAADIWLIFTSGVMRSSSTAEVAGEMRLMINGGERDLWGYQNNNATAPCEAGFLIFDRITGTVAEQTVQPQFRAAASTTYVDDIRTVAVKLPPGADFQYLNSDAVTSHTGADLSVMTHTFTPSGAGNYYILGKVSHHEGPSGATSQAWFEGADATQHPNSPAGTHSSNARDAWNPVTHVWRENMAVASQSIDVKFTSSGVGGAASETRYRKIMAFREDAWEAAQYDLSAADSATTSASYVQKNSLTTATPPGIREYLVIQTARVGGTNSATVQKAGELRKDGSPLVRTNHRINRDNSSAQGYHHTIGCASVNVDAVSATYENGYLAPTGSTVNIAESAIVILRLAPAGTGATENTTEFGMNF